MATRVTSKHRGTRLSATKGAVLDKEADRKVVESTPPKVSSPENGYEYLCREILFSPLFLLSTMVYVTAARLSRWIRAKSLTSGTL
ncbi:MAG: hypothetical protein ACE5JC_02090, partial [Candidatus Zixiibacteriota bacterium]